MAAHAVEIHAQSVHVHRNLAERLHAIDVQRHAGRARDAGDFGDGLKGAQLVVGVHDGDQHGLRPQGAPHVVGTTMPPEPTRRRVTATPSRSSCRQGASTAGCSMALVITCGGTGRGAHHAEHRQVVGFGAAAGEDDFVGVGVDQGGQLPPRRLQPLLGALAEMVDAGSVTIHLTETRHHRLQNFRSDGGGGVVVEIEVLHLLFILTMRLPILTLTTDFGLSDHYVGTMKGVILGICPQAQIVDISHEVSPFEIAEGAYLIAQAYRYFPPKTVHVVVVDPGVGTARRPILMEAAGQYFMAPDNGVLAMIYTREEAQDPADLEREVFPASGEPHVSRARHLRAGGRAPRGRRAALAYGQADRGLPAARVREAAPRGQAHLDRGVF